MTKCSRESYVQIGRCFHLVIVLCVAIANFEPSESTPFSKMCTTSKCIEIAANILEKMDRSINPCENFYKFTCGKFSNSTTIHSNTSQISLFTAIEDDTLRKVGMLLSESSSAQIKPFQQAKNFFKLCMNRSDNIEEMNGPILEVLDKLGGWPVTKGDAWTETDTDWITLPAKLVKTGFPLASAYFIILSLTKDSKNSTQYVININSPFLFSPYGLFKTIDDTYTQSYYKKLVEYAVKFGAERERAEKELIESLRFQINLANIAEADETQMEIESSDMTIEGMMKKWSTIDWITYINSILSIVPNITIDRMQTVTVHNPNFITGFERLINSTPKRVIVNYAFSRVVHGSLDYLNLGYTKHDKNQANIENNSKFKYCVDETVRLLPDIVTAMFLRDYIDDNAKHKVMDIATNVKKQLIKTIQKVEWFHQKTHKKIVEKISSMNYFIGYPDRNLNDNSMIKYYHDLKLDGRNFFYDVLNISRFNTMITYRSIMDTSSFLESWLPVIDINAYYNKNNHLSISSGLLQSPFFSIEQPAYMNYGAIGTIIGHEMVHGIDINKILSLKIYVDNVSCIVHQYSNYTVEEVKMKLNGSLTQIENIADNIGTRMSYIAYRDWITKNKPEFTLPGLDYTPTQMFWISMSNMWCSKSNPHYLNYKIRHSTHSPHEFRILGTLSNIPEFSEDFNCPLESPMNPLKKCKIL